MKAVGAVLLLLLVPVLAGGQSLAEVAREERERRERLRSKEESSAGTQTEEDLALPGWLRE